MTAFAPILQVAPAELSIIAPTFNEAGNVRRLFAAVRAALPDVDWELIFVDDNSPDGTADAVRALARRDGRVRIVHRFGRRGLSSACLEGILASAAPFAAVIDADMQHDERVLRRMLQRMRQGDVDLVVGSRYMAGGSTGEWAAARLRTSRIATWIARRFTGTPMTDPMSGFFMVRPEVVRASLGRLSSVGFKILLDIAASAPAPLRIAELPYTFRPREEGESKLDALVLWEFAQLLLDKKIGHIVPIRFLSFAAVGGFGVGVHFAVLAIVYMLLGAEFGVAQGVATAIATSNNFFLNNMLTYRDQRLKGRRLIAGWVTFNLVCAVGALANVGVARWLFQHHNWWALSALAGIAVTTVWNYAMSGIFTWRRR